MLRFAIHNIFQENPLCHHPSRNFYPFIVYISNLITDSATVMPKLRKLIFIAIIANGVSFILFRYVSGIKGALGVPFVAGLLWLSALWLVTIVITIIVLSINRKALFEPSIRKWTILVSLFCTPLPVIALFFLMARSPEIYCNDIHTVFDHGKAYKTESWYRRSTGKIYQVKRYMSEVPGAEMYMKDSLWIYFDEKGDTLKMELYKNDSLLKTMGK